MANWMELEDNANRAVWQRLQDLNIATELISDAGTVENLIGMGHTLRTIGAGDFTDAQLTDAICWLD